MFLRSTPPPDHAPVAPSRDGSAPPTFIAMLEACLMDEFGYASEGAVRVMNEFPDTTARGIQCCGPGVYPTALLLAMKDSQ